MSHETDLQIMGVIDLGQHCAQETQRFFKRQDHDSRYCFELFRRAIQERDQVAWELICIQYQPLVAGWVKNHRGFPATGEEIQYFVNGAFGKISGTLTPEKFRNFRDAGSLLRYLKMCVHSVIVDHNRAVEQASLCALEDIQDALSTDPAPEEHALDQSYRQTFWKWIDSRLHDKKERSVIVGSFVLDLKPQEICERFPDLFADVDDVYRVKQNVLSRLRRDPELQKPHW